MINFTSDSAASFAPKKNPCDDIVQTPLGGLITPNPKKPKKPRNPQPLGGLIIPKPPKKPDGDEFVPRPLGGLITPPQSPAEPKGPKFPNPFDEKQNDRRMKVLKFIIGAEAAALLLIGGAALAKKILHK